MLRQRPGDLLGSQHQPTRCVHNHINGAGGVRQANGPQHLLGIFDGDVAVNADPQQRDGLLPVDQRDHPRTPLLLQPPHDLRPARFQNLLAQRGRQAHQNEKQEKQIVHDPAGWLQQQVEDLHSPLPVQGLRVFDFRIQNLDVRASATVSAPTSRGSSASTS